MNNHTSENNDTLYQKFINFFKNINCFFKCVYGDIETEQHNEVQHSEIKHYPINIKTNKDKSIETNKDKSIETNREKYDNKNIEIKTDVELENLNKNKYEVEIEPYIEEHIDPTYHVFTVKKNNKIFKVMGRESIKI
jgi:preprotein translocase subunit SecB